MSLDGSVNVYASCFIDNLGFGIESLNKYYGPVSGEEIFKNGTLAEGSGYFYDPETNEEYGGPVHTVESKYYKGSSVRDIEEEVFFVPETNMKIKIPVR